MLKLTELVREHSELTGDQVEHLQRLVSEWGMLADLSFADLLLYIPHDGQWVTVGHVRSATAQTMYEADFVGIPASLSQTQILDAAVDRGEVIEAEIEVDGVEDESRILAVPVVCDGEIIAVMTKEWVERAGRRPGELERAYSVLFNRFVTMVAEGSYPFAERVGDSSSAPRVGDGVMLLNRDAEVEYVSPNASSALHRVGIQASALGLRLPELGFHDGPVRQAFERGLPVIEEFEQGQTITLLARCVPTIEGGTVNGAVLLIRDVTELRKRDRLLLSKDATIREIHHRVKNNLQTISSLLRLQSRRLTHPEAISAVGESVRRIRTIALVHEALSREPGDDVTFLEIVRPLLRLAEEGLQSPDRPVNFTVSGDGGRIPAIIATPLSVVLTELLQNAVDHGFPEGSAGGAVVVALEAADDKLYVTVLDDGRGVEAGFKLEDATGLGLSIVRTLVTTELDGTIEMLPLKADHERASLLPSGGSHGGTVVELTVPTIERL